MKCVDELIAELDEQILDIRQQYYEAEHDWTEHESAIRILSSKYESHRLHPVVRLLAERGLTNYMRHKIHHESLPTPCLRAPDQSQWIY